MKNLFNLFLTVVCTISCYGAFISTNTKEFALSYSMMCVSSISFLLFNNYFSKIFK